MSHNYIATLNDLPVRHRGVIFEQLHLASIIPTFAMRGLGICLPGRDEVPTQEEIYLHLCGLANNALQGYYNAREAAPAGHPCNETWGEDFDSIFHVEITGLSKTGADGYTISVDLNLLNLLYR